VSLPPSRPHRRHAVPPRCPPQCVELSHVVPPLFPLINRPPHRLPSPLFGFVMDGVNLHFPPPVTRRLPSPPLPPRAYKRCPKDSYSSPHLVMPFTPPLRARIVLLPKLHCHCFVPPLPAPPCCRANPRSPRWGSPVDRLRVEVTLLNPCCWSHLGVWAPASSLAGVSLSPRWTVLLTGITMFIDPAHEFSNWKTNPIPVKS
jgi:hypothetical protein